MTIQETKIYIRNELSDYYPKNEVLGFIKIIFEDVFNLSTIDLFMMEKDVFSKKNVHLLKRIINRLKKYEPIQYVIGFSYFYGYKFFVNNSVLIPRQETEELVDLIIKENKNKLRILDIGTGSGCIAISLKKTIKQSDVFAIDICKDALNIAKRNSLENNTEISFIQANMLNYIELSNLDNFDIIVSNPPYVTNLEKQVIDKNVLNYEPHLALFVEDNNPLIFYKEITKFASKHLNPNGKLYFEINEKFSKETEEIMLSFNFKNTEIIKDINGKNRFVKGLL